MVRFIERVLGTRPPMGLGSSPADDMSEGELDAIWNTLDYKHKKIAIKWISNWVRSRGGKDYLGELR